MVVEAPPGAGKTTRVPARCSRRAWPARARSGCSSRGGCRPAWRPRGWPRELGERVGETVGYSVRFDEAGGPAHAAAVHDRGAVRPAAARRSARCGGVSAVVLDELHERHVATDLALAWLRRLRETTRPELAVVAMSATLEAEPVRAFSVGPASDAAPHRAQRGAARSRSTIEHLSVAEAADASARSSGGSRRRCGSSCARSPTATCWCFSRAPPRSGARRPRSPSCRRRRRWPSCRCTARCRSRSRRAPSRPRPPAAARWSWRPTSPSRRSRSTAWWRSSTRAWRASPPTRPGRACRRWRSPRSAAPPPSSAPAARGGRGRDARCASTRSTTSSSARPTTCPRSRAPI